MQVLRRPLFAVARQTIPRTAQQTSGIIRTQIRTLQHLQRPYSATASPTPTSPSPTSTPPTGFPLNLPKWLSENSHLLQPPINNYCIYSSPMTVMVVGGPNARTDYHINETPEFFYQYKGRMLLKTVQQDKFVDIYINEGELFLLPANTPHNPVRFAETVGIVIEQPRPEGSLDRLRWYCEGCGSVVKEASFHCTDLGSQIKNAVNAFKEDEEARKCGECGTVCNTAPSEETMERMRVAVS